MNKGLNTADIIGFIAAILSTIAFIPQVVKTWETKSARDVSFTLLVTFSAGCLSWVIYGILVNSKPVTIANTITLILNITILGMKLTFEKKEMGETIRETQK